MLHCWWWGSAVAGVLHGCRLLLRLLDPVIAASANAEENDDPEDDRQDPHPSTDTADSSSGKASAVSDIVVVDIAGQG